MTDKVPVLVTGGAGYIGSHAVLALTDAGWPVVVVDNLSTGFRFAIPDGVPLIEADIGDQAAVEAVMRAHEVKAVMHFAGSIVVPESVENPLKYYHNNTVNSRALMVEHYYENSIIDAETGLYSNPYAMFSMKEKILAGLPFSVAYLRFADADFRPGTASKTARTAIRVLRENYSAEDAPVIARGAGSTILIIFSAHKTGVSPALKAMAQLQTAYTNLGKRVPAGIIEDSASCGNGPRVLKLLEKLADKSAQSGKLEVYKAQEHLNII